jgi:D-alanine--poly(phosphoribitol) ligase subunit 2
LQQQNTLELVYAAIDEVNAESADGAVLTKGPDVRLLGGGGSVDSLTFVNLIIALEEQIQRTLHTSVVLVNEESMTLANQPFRTVGALAEYVERLLAAQAK